MKTAALALTTCLALGAQEPAPRPYFYRPEIKYGSESQFNPLTSFLTWTFDTLQVPESFDENDYWKRAELVRENLRHPGRAIHQRGSLGDFINRQVLPFRMTEPDWIPNYSLHVLGGGMVYRKNAEWFQAHGVPFPRLTSALLCMTAELAQEVVEKASTKPDDEVADVFLMRPLGMLLFSFDGVADFAANTLNLAEWPYQALYDPDAKRQWGSRGRFVNVGQNFIVKPSILGWKDHRPFAFFGMTNLFGMTHRVRAEHSVSWGLGAAMVHAQDPTTTRFAGGIFWDRNNSLMASLIVNGTDRLRVRLNLHPGVIGGDAWWSPGLFVGYGDRKDWNAGITFRFLPAGYAKLSNRLTH